MKSSFITKFFRSDSTEDSNQFKKERTKELNQFYENAIPSDFQIIDYYFFTLNNGQQGLRVIRAKTDTNPYDELDEQTIICEDELTDFSIVVDVLNENKEVALVVTQEDQQMLDKKYQKFMKEKAEEMGCQVEYNSQCNSFNGWKYAERAVKKPCSVSQCQTQLVK